jgi:hypothetical protein
MDDGGHPGDLIFHLDEFAAVFGQFFRHDLCDLGGGGDGVTGIEANARVDRAESASFVALHQTDIRHWLHLLSIR